MPSFFPLARRIEPWPAGAPGELNPTLLNAMADEVYMAEISPVTRNTPPVVVEGEYLVKHTQVVATQLTNVYFCLLRDGRVVCPPVAVINRHKDIFGDISVDWRHPRTNHKYRGWKFVRSPLRLSGKSLCLAATGAETFFHLIFDSLGRLWLAGKAGFRLQDFDYLIVQKDTPILRRFLELLGARTDRLIDLAKVRHVRCENLFIGSYQSAMGHYHPEFLAWLRGKMAGRVSRGSGSSGKTLFLSRNLAKSRRLINEEQIEKAFPRKGILRVSLETFSLDEQLDLFCHADSVVAPHGGGLSHLAWVNQSMPILELFPPGFFNACYWELSSSIGAHYGCFEGQSMGKDSLEKCDFTIPPETVLKNLQFIKGRHISGV